MTTYKIYIQHLIILYTLCSNFRILLKFLFLKKLFSQIIFLPTFMFVALYGYFLYKTYLYYCRASCSFCIVDAHDDFFLTIFIYHLLFCHSTRSIAHFPSSCFTRVTTFQCILHVYSDSVKSPFPFALLPFFLLLLRIGGTWSVRWIAEQ